MGRVEALTIRPNDGPQTLSDGTQVIASVVDIRSHKRKKPGKVAKHEARHAYLGAKRVGVEIATVLPGPGYRGMVRTKAWDDVTAAGSYDQEGNGYDLGSIQARGGNVGSAISAAKHELSGKDEIIDELGVELEDAGTLDGNQINNIITLAERRRVIDTVAVAVTTIDGTTEEFVKEVKKGEVILVDFAKKKRINENEETTSQNDEKNGNVIDIFPRNREDHNENKPLAA